MRLPATNIMGGSIVGPQPAPTAPVAGYDWWVKADQIPALSDGDPVSTWADQSGNGRDINQSASNRPVYKTNIQNGLPVVRFSRASSQHLDASSFAPSGQRTIFLVLKPSAFDTNVRIFISCAQARSDQPSGGLWLFTSAADGSLAIQSGLGGTWVDGVSSGAGTLAAYARPDDDYRLYEINPLVEKIAMTQFTFIPECPAPHRVVLGDARLSLETEPPQNFDLLIMDAFSGDAIPVHLITREAFQIYWRHVKPDGVLAVHVSNRFLDVGPVVAMQAEQDGKRVLMFSYAGNEENDESASDYRALSILQASRSQQPLHDQLVGTM